MAKCFMNEERIKNELVDEWFRKGDEDELSINSIMKSQDGFPGSVCFMSQQMVEKYLKGLLLYITGDYPKSHDLVYLMELLRSHIDDIVLFRDDFVILREYYISTRYPGDFPEFTWRDAEEAVSSARKIKEFVLKKVRK